MKTELVAPLFALALAACATSPKESTTRTPEESKLSVSQVGLQSAAEFVACGHCAPPTGKAIAVARAAPSRAVPAESQPASVEFPKRFDQKIFDAHFRSGISQLDAAGSKEPSTALPLAIKQGTAVTVPGRTDPTDSGKDLARQALKGAQNVRNELVVAGVPAEATRATTSLPYCESTMRSSEEMRRKLRRTDAAIILTTP